MTIDLRDGLHEVAERRPAAVPPPDLWRRGVRRRRTRRAAAGVVVAAVALGVVGTAVGWDALRAPAPAPATPTVDGAIPDRLQTPSPWLDGTEGDPPGPLAVIAGAERRTGWRGEVVNGWVGVSAGTGEYRFLDLPGAVDLGAEDMLGSETDPSLSPDGRSVAYWLTHPENADWVGGWASYDTVSGEVVRHRVPSRLGLSPETLEWAGNGTVLVEYSVVTQRSSDSMGARGRPMGLWSPATGEVVKPDDHPTPVSSVWPTKRGVVTVDGRKVVRRNAVTGRTDLRLKVRTSRDVNDGTVNAEGTAVAFLPHTPDSSVRRLLVGEIPPDAVDGGVVPTAVLPVDLDMYHLIGWQDTEHVLVRGAYRTPKAWHVAVYAVDVGTGAHEVLVRETRVSWIGSPDYADELWARPTVRRPGPDRAYDPRVIAGTGVLLVAGAVVLLGRRRRARR